LWSLEDVYLQQRCWSIDGDMSNPKDEVWANINKEGKCTSDAAWEEIWQETISVVHSVT
jgi:hypothetical protein